VSGQRGGQSNTRVIGWLDLKTYKNYPIYIIYKWTNHENQSPEKALPIKTKKLTMKRKPCSFLNKLDHKTIQSYKKKFIPAICK